MTIIILFWCGSAFGSCAVPYKPVSLNVSSEPQTFSSVISDVSQGCNRSREQRRSG